MALLLNCSADTEHYETWLGGMVKDSSVRFDVRNSNITQTVRRLEMSYIWLLLLFLMREKNSSMSSNC